MRIFSTVIICLGTLNGVWCYEDGAGVSSCQSRWPLHGFAPQKTESPYQLVINRQYVYKNEKIRISINGTQPFKGFMIQAKHISDPSPVGKFHNSVGGVNMDCGSYTENTISHYNSDLKNRTMVEWEALRVRVDYVEFFATVVYDMKTFWIDLKTPRVYIIENTAAGNRISNIYRRPNASYLYSRPTLGSFRYNYFSMNRSRGYDFRRRYK